MAIAGELGEILGREGGALGRYAEQKAAFERMNTDEVAGLFGELDLSRARLRALQDLDRALASTLEDLDAIDLAAAEGVAARQLDGPLKDWWEEVVAADADLAGLRALFEGKVAEVRTEIEGRRTDLGQKIATQEGQRDKTEDALREKTHTDATVSIKSEQREEARRRFEAADALRQEYLAAFERLEQTLAERAELLESVAEQRTKIGEARGRTAETLTEQLASIGADGPKVEIAVESGADVSAYEKHLDEQFLSQERGGQFRRIKLAEKLAKVPPSTLAWAIMAGDAAILRAGGEGADGDHAERLVGKIEPFAYSEDAEVIEVADELEELLVLQEQPVDDVVRIRSDGEPVDKLSPVGAAARCCRSSRSPMRLH